MYCFLAQSVLLVLRYTLLYSFQFDLLDILPGAAAIPLLWKFFNRWPNPDVARRGDWQAIARLMTPLGLHEKRAHTIIRFSSEFL